MPKIRTKIDAKANRFGHKICNCGHTAAYHEGPWIGRCFRINCKCPQYRVNNFRLWSKDEFLRFW